MKGIVKTKPTILGFGFITGQDGVDYFFHRRNLPADLAFESLMPGERVSFDVTEHAVNPRAASIMRADDDA